MPAACATCRRPWLSRPTSGYVRGRLRKGHTGAQQVNRSKSATGLGRVLRDAMFPVLMERFGSPQALAWLYGHRIEFDSTVTS